MKAKTMKDEILELIASRREFPLTGLFDLDVLREQIAGDSYVLLPIENVENSNIVLISGVNEGFAELFRSLIREGILSVQPCDVMEILWYNSGIYGIPVAKKIRPYKHLRWLPVLLKKGKKFPKSIIRKPMSWDD